MDTLLKGFAVLLASVFMVALVMFIALPIVALNAYIAQDLWALFILPSFGLAVPPLWTMAGLFLCTSLVKGVKLEDDKKDKKDSDSPVFDAFKPFLIQLVTMLIIWGEGHLFYWLGH